MSKDKLSAAMCVAAICFAQFAGATSTASVSQTFDSLTANSSIADVQNWTGGGIVTAGDITFAGDASVGRPISQATAPATGANKFLSVEGAVECALTDADVKPTTVDFMIQVKWAEEALEIPEEDNSTPFKVALGVETNGTLKVYCGKKDGSGNDWLALGETVYVEDSWHRLSLTFDPTAHMCLIRLDGEPLMTAEGYASADTSLSPTVNGAWYRWVTTTSANALQAVKLVGTLAVDEFLVKKGDSVDDAVPPLADAAQQTAGVPNAWIEAQGITRAQASGVSPDGVSGMTVADKYKSGINVWSPSKYEISAIDMKGAVGTLKVRLSIPSLMTPPAGFQNVIVYGTTSANLDSKKVIDTTDGTVELDVPATGVSKIYYQMKNEPVQQ